MSSDFKVDSNMNSSKDGSGVVVPDEARVPIIENKEASITRMLKDYYGLTVTSLKPLNGYDDLNFHVRTETDFSNPHIDAHHPEGYFLKISNLQDTQQPEMLHAQWVVMDHLISKGVVCQEAIKGVNGEVFTEITSTSKSGKNVTYAASLRTFLPGRVIAGNTLTAKLLFQLGVFAAKVTEALQNFNLPFYETFDHLWNLSQLSKVSDVLFAVKDEKNRKTCEDVIKAFETDFLPNRNSYRVALIHGDLNEHNVLIDTDPSSDSGFRISGLLDFQDSAKSYPVYDIALFIAYMLMTGNSEVPQEDIPGHMLAGYTSVLDLPPVERRVLRICIAARMVMSLGYGAYTYHLDPTNEYVLDTAKFGWQALAQFWEAEVQSMEDRWDEIIQTYKS